MPNVRHFYYAVLPQILGSVTIGLGLLILILTQVADPRFAKIGLLVGFPLVIVGGIVLTLAGLVARKRLH